MARNDHVQVLDHLRGLASAAVCFFHFTNGNSALLDASDWIRSLGWWGSHGVDAFFVVSGFVIPYSLFKRRYRPSQALSFLARRLKRLEPPYLACIALVLLLNAASAAAPGFRGPQSNAFSAGQVLSHLGYLNAVLGYDWINPVFWTLAIEFQFYLFISLAFGIVASPHALVRVCATPFFAGIGLCAGADSSLLPHWLPLFSLGTAVAQFFHNSISKFQLAVCLSICGSAAYAACGTVPAIVGIGTALIILGMGYRELPSLFRPLQLLGVVSYSLYLMHVPVGMRIVNLACRMPYHVGVRYAAIVLAFAVSVAVAIAYYRLVELPSARWSQAT